MEDDAGAKAPVTRLRRRLSVEQPEESKSPATNTPTKRRGGRAAKPNLELIEENATVQTPKEVTAKKTVTKDLIETTDEKPVTPSRRSARIRSNTSIISETPSVVDSPRTRRAARRVSQVGSDNEAPLTPARQTRRTRKESTSSIDKVSVENQSTEKQLNPEPITEENETVMRKSITNSSDNLSDTNNTSRKSPRLSGKKERKSIENKNIDNKTDDLEDSNKSIDNLKSNIKVTPVVDSPAHASVESPAKSVNKKERLSIGSAVHDVNVCNNGQTRRTRKESTSSIDKVSVENQSTEKQLNPEPITEENETVTRKSITNSSDNLSDTNNTSRKSPRLSGKKERKSIENKNIDNKTDDLEDSNNLKSNIKVTPAVDSPAHASVESPAKSVNKKERLSIGSAVLLENLNSAPQKKISNLNKSTSALENQNFKNKRSRTKSFTSVSDFTANDNMFYSDNEGSKKRIKSSPMPINISGSGDNLLNKSEKDKKSLIKENDNGAKNNKSVNENDVTLHDVNVCNNDEDLNTTSNMIKQSLTNNKSYISDKEPNKDLHTATDSDTNSDKICLRSEDDQCVPELGPMIESPKNKQETFNDSNKSKNESIITESNLPVNNSCEPMDIDETIPESMLVQDIGNNGNNASVQNKSLSEKSKRKSISQNLDNSANQSKSTLILSHLKDECNETKSPQKLLEENKRLSQSTLNISQENILNKKHIASCYSTSTPLQQKKYEKGIHVNDSCINPELSESNTKKLDSDSESSESEVIGIKAKHQKKKLESDSESSESEVIGIKAKHQKKKEKALASTDSEESDEESSSQENNSLIDDGAHDAGEDYQSGDSQDEEEREYIANNEIIEKGETLSTDTSNEENSSNDSDYEKDSFIVSSDEEDDELLEGTEDDLSMSDNELKMTAKSKQKYNERKLKEQKKASREMFESRHKLSRSKNSSDSETDKKKKKERQMSSSSESDYDIIKSVKSTNRKQRFDSSQDDSISNESNKKSGRRSRGVSASESSKSPISDNKIIISSEVTNEASNEITSCKNASMAFINVNEHIDKNISIKNEEEQVDPIDAASLHDDSSMSSDNEKIVQDYDSILQDLNKSNKKKNKVNNISLNHEVKPKKKEKHSIVDELNLTQVKSKKPKNKTKESANTETLASTSNIENAISSSGDSDYLKLMFSEESNNCEEFTKRKNEDNDGSVIHLKKSDGKTNIHDKAEKNNSSMIKMSSKTPPSGSKNKKQQQDVEDTEDSSSSEGAGLQFFIDTEGTNKSNTSINKIQFNKIDEDDDNSDSDAPMEILFKKEKNLSRTHNKLEEDTDDNNLSVNKSVVKTPQSGKKKRQLLVEDDAEENVNNLSVTNKSVVKTPQSGKKKRQSLVEDDGEKTNVNNVSVNKSAVKTPQSAKKQRQSLAEEDGVTNDNKFSVTNKSVVKTPQSGKKKRQSLVEDDGEENDNNLSVNKSVVKTPQSGKKKRQSLVEEEEINVVNTTVNKSLVKTPQSGKKQRLSLAEDDDVTNVDNLSVNKSVVKTPQSGKKKRQSLVEEDGEENVNNLSVTNMSVVKTPQSGKKKRQSLVEEEEINVNNVSVNKSVVKTPQSAKKQRQSLAEEEEAIKNKSVIKTPQSGKKKRQSLAEANGEENVDNLSVNKSVVKTPQSGKKKRQSLVEEEEEYENNQAVLSFVKTPQSEKKKKSTVEQTKQTDEISTSDLSMNKLIKTPMSDKKKNKSPKVKDIGAAQLVNIDHEQGKNKKRKRKLSAHVSEEVTDSQAIRDVNKLIINEKKKPKLTQQLGNNLELSKKIKNKKRKEREDDDTDKSTKASIEQSLKKVKVSRLPSSLLEQLDEKRKPSTTVNVTSTTGFIVEEIRRRKNKPSMYLEESIYLNESEKEDKKYRAKKEKPKVLPFVPTASTSSTGYTTNFKVNVIKQDTAFVAKTSEINNFKNDHLYNKKIKRLGTYEVYKKSRNLKLSKF